MEAGAYDPDVAWANVQWAGAAYCCGTMGNGCSQWTCPSCQGAMETLVFSDPATEANGFVGYTVDTNAIVVSFSGTDPLKIKNWIDDLSTTKEAFEGYEEAAR